jgi:hypothetical protein
MDWGLTLGDRHRFLREVSLTVADIPLTLEKYLSNC